MTSYQEQSHIANDHVLVCIIMITTRSYQEQSHIGNDHVQVCKIMITSYQNCHRVVILLDLYLHCIKFICCLVYQPVLMQKFFHYFHYHLSCLCGEQFKYALYNFSEIPTYSVFTVTVLSPLTPYNVCS